MELKGSQAKANLERTSSFTEALKTIGRKPGVPQRFCGRGTTKAGSRGSRKRKGLQGG